MSRECAGLEHEKFKVTTASNSIKLNGECHVIVEIDKNGELGKNSREEWRNSREEGSVAWLSSCSRNRGRDGA
jgi:hypothetical protein